VQWLKCAQFPSDTFGEIQLESLGKDTGSLIVLQPFNKSLSDPEIFCLSPTPLT